MLLYITRHGQTIDNVARRMQGQRHGKLTELGITQAKKLAIRLQNEWFDAVYCSDRGRAVETALTLIELNQELPIVYTADLQEKNIWSYAGLTVEECDEHDKEFWLHTDGETDEEFQKRAENFVKMIEKKHKNHEKILIVAHAAINRRIVAFLLWVDVSRLKQVPWQPNAALTILEKIDDNWNMVVENEVWYLGDLLGNYPTNRIV